MEDPDHQPTVSYHTNDYIVVACIDDGRHGKFRIGLSRPEPLQSSHSGNQADHGSQAVGHWEFFPVNSDAWDSLHQSIYWRGDFDQPTSALLARLPPLPPLPAKTRQSWADNFGPPGPFPAADWPACTAWLSATGGPATAWFALREDLYETKYGDGCFRYFDNVAFISAADASLFCADQSVTKNMGCRLHQRSLNLSLTNKAITALNFQPELYDHYTVPQVLAALENRLRPAE